MFQWDMVLTSSGRRNRQVTLEHSYIRCDIGQGYNGYVTISDVPK
jgi:hypothetical protein